MKALIILLFFLVSGCPLDKLKTGNSKSKKGAQSSKSVDREVAYETPPHAPIPPEKYCYELHSNAQGVTKLELTVTLDSVLGKLDHFPARANEPNGILIGTIYDGTLLVSYQYTFEGKNKTEDQEWKISGDSIFRKIIETVKRDSSHVGAKDSDRVVFMPALHKAPCI